MKIKPLTVKDVLVRKTGWYDVKQRQRIYFRLQNAPSMVIITRWLTDEEFEKRRTQIMNWALEELRNKLVKVIKSLEVVYEK